MDTDGTVRLSAARGWYQRRRRRRFTIGALLIVQVLCLAGVSYVTVSRWAWSAADGATITAEYVTPDMTPAHPASIMRISVTKASEAHRLQYWMNETTVATGDNPGGNYIDPSQAYNAITIAFTWHCIVIESAHYDTRYPNWVVTVLGYVDPFQAIRIPKDGATPVLQELLATYPQLPTP